MTQAEALAIQLHEDECKHNHTDGCSWFYAIKDGVHDWKSWPHSAYLKRALEIIAQ